MTSKSRRTLLTAAAIAVAVAAADTYVVVLALPDMMASVGVSLDALQEATPIISGFLLGYVTVLPLVGRVADLVERRRVLLGCLLVFVVGSAVTALAPDLWVLVAGRVVQGAGGGGLVPATLALVADLWPVGRRGVPLGVVGAVQELGSVLGPVAGAAILAVSGWRTIFWLGAATALVLAGVIAGLGPAFGRDRGQGRGPRGSTGLRSRAAQAATLAALVLGGLALAAPDVLTTDVTLGTAFIPLGDVASPALTPVGIGAGVAVVAAAGLSAHSWWPVLSRADALGAGLLGVALACLVLTFASADPQSEVVGPLGAVLLPGAAVAVALYAWRHRTAATPVVPRGVLGPRTGAALVVSSLVGAALVAVVVDVPVLARLTVTDSEAVAALILLRFLVAVPVGALAGGYLLGRLSDGVVAGVGLLLAAAGLGVMGTWGEGALDSGGSTLTLAAVGLGMGLALAPVNNAALAAAPADAHATASALVVVARMVGMIVGLSVLTALGLHRYYDAVDGLPDPTDTGALVRAALVQVRTVFAGAAVSAGLGGALALAGLGVRRVLP